MATWKLASLCVLLHLAAAQVALPSEFKYLPYTEIVTTLHALHNARPDIVELSNAQDAFGIDSPGQCGGEQCKQWYVRITNKATLPMANGTRPQVFLSGCVHGNERVGPTTVTEFARALVSNYNKPANEQEPWLTHLVDSREIWIMPSANALGYYQNVREENGVDPNRDFAFDQSPYRCMQTTAARAINELWRRNLFQLAITFHGGMRAIAYEWGSYNHLRPSSHWTSPDDTAQAQIAQAMSDFAGGFTGSSGNYPHLKLNDLVYPVHGGMEDWAYAGSWDHTPGDYGDPIQPCTPGTSRYSSYDKSRTQYTADMLRGFNFLVETADAKTPSESLLGQSDGWLSSNSQGDGHIPRNMRLCAIISELVQPYVSFVHEELQEIVQLLPGTWVRVTWTVGGALQVDSSKLHWIKWDGDPSICQDGNAAPEALFGDEANTSEAFSGKNVWGANGLTDSEAPWQPFAQSMGMPQEEGVYLFAAVASVDGMWGRTDSAANPTVPPQSHVANARTNSHWVKSVEDHKVAGRTRWVSELICVNVTREASPFNKDPWTDPRKRSDPSSSAFTQGMVVAGTVGTVVVLGAIALLVYWRRRQPWRMVNNIDTLEEEDQFATTTIASTPSATQITLSSKSDRKYPGAKSGDDTIENQSLVHAAPPPHVHVIEDEDEML